MSNIYSLDEQFLKDTIKKGQKLLLNPNTSKKRKKYIKDSIKTFERFLEGDYDLYPEDIPQPKNINSLKNQLLQNMRFAYTHLGEDAITSMIFLSETDIFYIPTDYEETELSMEEQVSLTLKNYKKVSPSYYAIAKQIIESKNPPQIQETEYLSDSSYVHECSISTLPFLIIDTMDAPWIFNHEMQHAIETYKRYKTNLFYTELGSQFMEISFLEQLYQQQGYINALDYASRITDTYDNLQTIKQYLEMILLFSKKNFQISTDEFIETLSDTSLVDEETLYYSLLAEYIDTDINPTIYYTISYLKAIELYGQTKQVDIDKEIILSHYLKRPTFEYKRPTEGVKVYEKYISDMDKKTK